MGLNVLILGGSAATHALAWKIFDSPQSDQLICAPGNGGTSSIFAPSEDLDVTSEAEVLDFVFQAKIDLVVTNAAANAAGLGRIEGLGDLRTLGVARAITPLLSSRCALKDWLVRHQLPTARGRAFSRLDDAEKYAASQPLPLLISADDPDGAILLCTSRGDIPALIRQASISRDGLGVAGIVVEEAAGGPLVLAQWLMDETAAVALPAVRVFPEDGDRQRQLVGGQTASTPLWSRLEAGLGRLIMAPAAAALRGQGEARGWITAECVLAPSGPLITRLYGAPTDFGVTAALPRLQSDLVTLLDATAHGRLVREAAPVWTTGSTVAVLLHSPTRAGQPVRGLDSIENGALVFHGSTSNRNGLRYRAAGVPQMNFLSRVSTNLRRSVAPDELTLPTISTTGPAILTVVGAGETLATAAAQAYAALAQIRAESSVFDATIGSREL